jgi:EAL domain-containing protein (putative c-di-GMP-specific phosphodiesterase class I)
MQLLERIRRLGLIVSIDDFGAGYSSLAYLKSLPASEIKIDKSLIAGICDDINSDMVARATIDMCQGLGFKVVAEGVENQIVLNRLVELGCDTIQGYILTPPLPYEELINWLEDNLDNKRFVS